MTDDNENERDDGEPPRRAVIAGFIFVVALVVIALYLANSMIDVCAVARRRIC